MISQRPFARDPLQSLLQMAITALTDVSGEAVMSFSPEKILSVNFAQFLLLSTLLGLSQEVIAGGQIV